VVFKPQAVFASAAAAQAEELRARVFDIRYQIDPRHPDYLSAVVVVLTADQPAPASLHVRFPAHGPVWYSCRAAGSTWTCATPDAPALDGLNQMELSGAR
jgi:hypothetical protein